MSSSARNAVHRLMRLSQTSACPCHGCASQTRTDVNHLAKTLATQGQNTRGLATPINSSKAQGDYAFEVAASNIRFGEGVTQEVGMDFKNMNATKVGVYTDSNISKLLPMKQTIQSLETAGVSYEVFDQCRVEPNLESWEKAIDFAKKNNFSHFLAVGGGSVIDTCKVSNLYTCYPDAELLDFVNAPVGKGKPIEKKLRPLIAVPTTAGTGSETTGTAIFDYTPLLAKTGIASRALKPILGVVDPLNTDTCSEQVHVSAGLDVLFHALESYTAIPYDERTPRPTNPINRPAYQGRNPISDVFSMWALRQAIEYLPRIKQNQGDKEAKRQMLLASTFAGIGFGNAGVHLCHGMSYPISGLNKKLSGYKHPGYNVDHLIVPHGVSVALTGPAVFDYTAASCPDRHREAARLFDQFQSDGIQTDRVGDADIGKLLHDRIARFLVNLEVPRGLSGIGYKREHISELVTGTLPQRRVLDLAPGFSGTADDDSREDLSKILESAMSF